MAPLGGLQMCMGWTTARESGNQVKSRFIGVVTVALLSFNGQTGTLARARDTRLPASPPTRMAAGLGGLWRATLDSEDRGEREEYFKPDFAAQRWKDVNVPASFANVAPEIDRYEGVGWFRKSFRLPD